MKEIIIVYILEYLIILIPTIVYKLLNIGNLNYFITNYIPIISIIFNIIIVLFLIKNNTPYIGKIKLNNIYVLISIGIITSCIYNTLIFRIIPIKTTTNIPLILNILSTGLIGPILEEILFRYILLNRLLKKYNIKKSLIISTIIFSIIHISIIKVLYTLILGTILGIVYLNNNKNILYPIIIHVSANIMSIFLYSYDFYILYLSILLIIVNTYLIIRKKEIIWHQP